MDATDMILTFTGNLPGIQRLVWYSAIVIGVCLSGAGLWMLATARRTGGFSQGKGMGFTLVVFGALLVNMSYGLAILAASLSNGQLDTAEYVLSRVQPSGNPLQDWVAALLLICIVLGWFSTTKGLAKLAVVGGVRDQGMLKGVVYVVIGALLTNPHFFLHVLGASFGVEDQVSIFVPGT